MNWNRQKKNNGFMVQVVELLVRTPGRSRHDPGELQTIETEMAKSVGCKIFRVYQPDGLLRRRQRFGYSNDGYSNDSFDEQHIHVVVEKIQDWRNDDCRDLSECDIYYEEEPIVVNE